MSEALAYDPGEVVFPPQPLCMEQLAFQKLVLPVAEVEDLFLTSYFRTPLENQRVGGAQGSLHTQGLAMDLDKFGADLQAYEAIANELNARNLAVLIYYDSDRSYMHVQFRPLLSGRLLGIVT